MTGVVEAFKRNLRARLDTLGFSQRAASLRAGLGPDAVRDIYRKGGSPTLQTAEALARALNVQLTDLLSDGTPASSDPEDAAFPALGDCSGAGAAVGVHVVLRDAAGRYLCQLRDEAPPDRPSPWRLPGRWGLFGGAVEAGETARAAAVRELAEETGVAIAPADLRPLCKVALVSAPDRPLLYMFSAATTARPADLRLTEGSGFAFFSLSQARASDLIPEHLAALEADALRG